MHAIIYGSYFKELRYSKVLCLKPNKRTWLDFNLLYAKLLKILLLQQVCSYSSALREVGMHETMIHKPEKKKTGQRPCPESQRALRMLNGDKQNEVKVLPDLP